MVQPVSKAASFRAVPAHKTAAASQKGGFTRSGVDTSLPSSGTLVRASQDVIAKDIQKAFIKVNPGEMHSVYTFELTLLNGKRVTVSGTKDNMTVTGDDFELKIEGGKLASVDGVPGELGLYRVLLLVADALEKAHGGPGRWPVNKPGA